MVNFIAQMFPWIGKGKETNTENNRVVLKQSLLSFLFRRLQVGTLDVHFYSGAKLKFIGVEKGPKAELKINNIRFFALTIYAGDLGFAESYMKGYIDTPNLTKLLMLGALNEAPVLDFFKTAKIKKVLNQKYHTLKANTRDGSHRNIATHYDLGNNFYKLWLGKMMTYSSAIFVKPEESLETAQHRKYRLLAEKLNLMPGEQILEIGCGWGDFAEFAAREYGCKVLAITLSREQASYVRARIRNSDLSKKVEISLLDYRDVKGTFDKIVSIEMFEAVGQEYWSDYFAALKKYLRPNGCIGLQVITIADAYFDKYKQNPEFIQRYIFPGGMLPSLSALGDAITSADMTISSTHHFGLSYAETLRRWHFQFLKGWPNIKELGFDERFRRMWDYYLSYCEVGFENGQINVGQYIIE